jgi:hypothetical protein
MAAIHYTDTGIGVRVGAISRLLTQAAFAALEAPSIQHTQPWRWRINENQAELYADRSRQLTDTDPDGRLLLISCGAALHHAAVALCADGLGVVVMRFPEPGNPDLLAFLRYARPIARSSGADRLRRAIAVRRSDSRPFADRRVSAEHLELLRAAAEAAGAGLHPLAERDVVGTLDRHARYLVITARGDLPMHWLMAGEALSAVLLTATAAGLASSSISDPAAVVRPAGLRRALAGSGRPATVVRIGAAGRVDVVPRPAYRPTAEVVEIVAYPSGPGESP